MGNKIKCVPGQISCSDESKWEWPLNYSFNLHLPAPGNENQRFNASCATKTKKRIRAGPVNKEGRAHVWRCDTAHRKIC